MVLNKSLKLVISRLATMGLKPLILAFLVIASAESVQSRQQNGSFGPRVTLIPEKHITPFYNLQEWIFTQMNWYYETYDMDAFRVRSPAAFPIMASGTKVFVNDIPYHNRRLLSDYHTFPEINLQVVDSIVVHSGPVVVGGLYSPGGAIRIYTEDLPVGALFHKAGINQINDPGLGEFNDMATRNVEYVRKNNQLIVSIPALLGTTAIVNLDDYSRTNVFNYDRVANVDMAYRPSSRVAVPGYRAWPSHDAKSLIIMNALHTRAMSVQSLVNYTKSNSYEWFDLAGVEIPSRNEHWQASLILQLHEFPLIESISGGFSHQQNDTFPNRNHLYIDLDETTIWQAMHWKLPIGSNTLQGSVHSETMHWKSRSSDAEAKRWDFNITAGLPMGQNGVWMGLGNQNRFIQYTLNAHKAGVLITAAAFHTDLRSLGYTYDIWQNELGFYGLNPDRHRINLESDLKERYLQATALIYRKNNEISWSLKTEFSHYATLVVSQVDYKSYLRFYPLETTLSFRDAHSVGLIFAEAEAEWRLDSRLRLKSTIAYHQRLYAPDMITDHIKRTPRWMVTSLLHYRLHNNARLELHYRYVSERFYPEFADISEVRNFPPLRGRPMHVVSATSRNYFMDQRVSLEIALRNLLNQTENWNTNGQYYNLSIGLAITVHARQRQNR
jgi:hypothetical protein